MNNLRRYGRVGLSLLLGVIFTLLAISTIYAKSPGDLDKTFNGTGIVTTTVGDVYNWGIDIAVQPDGKIVTVGEAGYFHYGTTFAVVRYTITGSLDITFNDTGIVTTPIGSYNTGNVAIPVGTFATAYSLAFQPDGKIVAAGGSKSNTGDDFAVARYTTSGELDSTFNNSGIVTTSIISGVNSGFTPLIQPDGKIVVSGYSERKRSKYNQVEYNFAVVRYTPTGTLDSTFNGTGIVTASIGISDDMGIGAALQPDGKIVAVGSSKSGGGDYDFAVVRYTSDGHLDPFFNNGAGFITTTISSGADGATRVAIQPDGKLVVVGYGDDYKYFVVARYTITGTLDTTFNQTGIATVAVDSSQEGDGVALQPDGKIIVVGNSLDSLHNGNFVVLRYRSDGILDSTFHGTGIVTTPVGRYGGGFSTAIQPDGKILAVGESRVITHSDITVIRYLGDPAIVVFNGAVNITNNANTVVDFGTTVVGSPITKTFTISNTSRTELTLTEPITVPSGFSVVHSFGDVALSAGEQTTFTIRLDAALTGTYTGELVFNNSDPDENPFNFVISGTVKITEDIYLPVILK